ncbi:DCC1-like thiol-disulfide oxidoreductase family protein [Algiphilus aromaticivorans]|uniref:DCC1-like thiol-disulfide oxidoreductase family protein n=1 Tax=Algiphilus aromaticivorans TaxID=382454 RepID=UPI0005C19138|nr:HTTM domain-containing protein [Algiphilus aromaticivorans]
MRRILQRWWRESATVDLRGLAVLRVLLGLVLLFELGLRLCDLGAFYGDAGVLPRVTLIEVADVGRISLLLAAGGAWWSGALIVAAWLAAAAFTLGWRTRAATIALFVLVASIQSRNPLILIGGDILIMALLLWSLFLPMATRWSADAALASTPPPVSNRHRSPAAFALLVQVVSVYFFSAVLKHGDAWWPDGTAVYYALELERYATALGRWLQGFPDITQALSYFVYFLEWGAPLLVFAPLATRAFRLLAFALLMLMHLGFLLCLELGHFPWVSFAALMALTTPALWDGVRRRLDRGGEIRIYYDRDCGFCLASCRLLVTFLVIPRATIQPAQEVTRAQRLMDAHWSWVVIDADNVAHLKYDAFVALLRASLLFRWLAPIAALAPLQSLGTRTYDLVANGRGGVAAATRWFWRPRTLRWRPSTTGQALAVLALLVITAWNAHSVGWLPTAALQPVAPSVHALRIDQRWDMFAPEPSRRDGWIVFPGQLENGRNIDLRADDGELDWQRPQPPNAHRNVRWHSYEWRLYELREEALFLAYGRYLCRQYNATATAGKRLHSFEMVYVIKESPAPGESAEAVRRTAWRHQCLPD